MNNFKKGGFRKGDGKFSGRKFGGGRDRGDRSGGHMQLFPAVCSECKKSCELPFRPTGDKPVYCRDCFSKQRQIPGRNSNGADGPRADFRRDAFPQREQQPEYARPQNNGEINALKLKLDSLESKVNRILDLVSKKPQVPAPVAAIVGAVPQAIKVKKAKSPARKATKKRKK